MSKTTIERVPFLTREQLRSMTPAAFSKTSDPKVTERYKFVPTFEVINRLEERGMKPVSAKQNRVTADSRWGLHEIRFQAADGPLVTGIRDDVMQQVVLVNSHDRTRRISIMAGFFRLICSNGLIAPLMGAKGESLAMSGRCLHLKNLNPDKLIDDALASLDRGTVVIKSMMSRVLNTREQNTFARQTIERIYGKYHKHFDPRAWLTPRRDADKKDDLWHVYNRVQENVMKGGVKLPSGRVTHPLGNAAGTGASTSVRVNEFLWMRAMQFLN